MAVSGPGLIGGQCCSTIAMFFKNGVSNFNYVFSIELRLAPASSCTEMLGLQANPDAPVNLG